MPTSASRFQLDQYKELEYRQELTGPFLLTYSFVRSKGRQTQPETPGDDYFEFCYQDERAVFAICDGVSQGFGGHIASRFLGTKLVNWLRSHDWKDETLLLKDLNLYLQKWTGEATETINSAPLPLSSENNENRRRYWEKKRAEGSQTMFVLGGLDYQKNKAIFFWLGDTRLFFDFRQTSTNSNQIEEWDKMQRWSTLDGALGNPSSRIYHCTDLKSVISYTDGLEDFLDNQKFGKNRFENLADLKITQPRDDVSFLVLDILSPSQQAGIAQSHPPKIISGTDSIIEFDKLPDGTWIRISCQKNDTIRVFDLLPEQTKLNLADHRLPGYENLSFQLISSTQLPSQSIPLGKGIVGPSIGKPVPIPTPPPSPTPPGPPPPTPAPPIWSKRKIWGAVLAGVFSIIIIVGAIFILPFFSKRNIIISFQPPTPTSSNYGVVNPADIVITVTLMFTPSPETLPTSTTTPTTTHMPPTSTLSSTLSPTTTPVPPTSNPTFIPTSIPPTQIPTSTLKIPSPTVTVSILSCSEFVTIAEGLNFYLQPDLSSEVIYKVPANRVVIQIDPLVDGEWKLLRDTEKPGGYIQGFVFVEDLMKSARCK